MHKRFLQLVAGAAAILAASLCPAADTLATTNGSVNFSFDQVEVRSFVKLVGEITGRKMVVDQNVEGKITVVFPKIPVSHVFPVFVSVIESAGCSVVEEADGVFHVISMGARPSIPAPVIGPDEKIPDQGLFTKIYCVKFASASDLRKLLESKVRGGKEGAIGSIGDNYVIVTDTAESLRRIQRIVTEVDKPGLSRLTEIVTLTYASAEEIAAQLTKAMSGTALSGSTPPGYRGFRSMGGTTGQPGGSMGGGMRTAAGTGADTPSPAVIVAAPHSNSLIIVGDQAQILELKRIIALMDVDTPSGRGRFTTIFLKYIPADDAAKSLNALLAKKRTAQAGMMMGGTSLPGQGINIEPHMANNALLVDAMPRDFLLVCDLVKEIDIMPQQVLIEVLIAEVSLNDGSDIGVDVIAAGQPSSVGDTVVGGSLTVRNEANGLLNNIQTGLFPKGLTVGLAKGIKVSDGSMTTAYPAILNLNAVIQKGKFNILSKVPLLAQNNHEASVSIVNNIPMLKSTVQGTGQNLNVIQNIDRVDVGIKLKLTPHINPNGDVLMTLNPSIEAIIDPGSIANNLAPTIAHREVSTTVTVPSGRTLVLSGLIREDSTSTDRRVPVLGSIPIIGWIFRRTSTAKEKTNLLIFVTPNVVKDQESADRITESLKERTHLLTTNSPPAGAGGDKPDAKP